MKKKLTEKEAARMAEIARKMEEDRRRESSKKDGSNLQIKGHDNNN